MWITLLNSIELYNLYDHSKTENVELDRVDFYNKNIIVQSYSEKLFWTLYHELQQTTKMCKRPEVKSNVAYLKCFLFIKVFLAECF